ncbi:MAG: hypothetical protein JWM75_2147 [Sphingomonas bacterium]|nr:hypothetical protein [Sphingomonas bacterium]
MSRHARKPAQARCSDAKADRSCAEPPSRRTGLSLERRDRVPRFAVTKLKRLSRKHQLPRDSRIVFGDHLKPPDDYRLPPANAHINLD